MNPDEVPQEGAQPEEPEPKLMTNLTPRFYKVRPKTKPPRTIRLHGERFQSGDSGDRS